MINKKYWRGWILFIAAVVFTSFASTTSASIIIDDFSTGAALLSDTTPGAGTEYATQSGLPTGNTAGGVRHMQVYSEGTPASVQVIGGTMNLTSPNANTYYTISYDGNPSGFGGGNPMLNLDLSDMDQFEITFSHLDRPFGFSINVRSGFSTAGSGYIQATQPGVIVIPLSNFGSVNWSDVDDITLSATVGYGYGLSSHTESISDIRVVPEPMSLSLVSLGAIMLFRRQN